MKLRTVLQVGVRLGMKLRTVLLGGLAAGIACQDEKKPTYEGPYAAQVTEAVPMIERAVGLKFKTAPKLETRSKAQVREFIAKQFTDPRAMRDLAGEEKAYKRLGLIPDTLKLQPFIMSLLDRKSTRLNSSHGYISYAVFCLK